MVSEEVLVSQYLAGYPAEIKQQVLRLVQGGGLQSYLDDRYSQAHQVVSNSQLRDYVLELKNQFMRQSAPLSKVEFDDKIHVLKNALGTDRVKIVPQSTKDTDNKDTKV